MSAPFAENRQRKWSSGAKHIDFFDLHNSIQTGTGFCPCFFIIRHPRFAFFGDALSAFLKIFSTVYRFFEHHTKRGISPERKDASLFIFAK